MKRQTKQPDNSRRAFIKNSALAGAGLAVGSTLPGAAVAETPTESAEKNDKGYHLTQHIVDYYKSAAS